MKKLFGLAIFAFLITGCGNSGEGDVNKDTLEPGINTNVSPEDERGDTSSYERMPETISDSVER
jgi:hypothetical protein